MSPAVALLSAAWLMVAAPAWADAAAGLRQFEAGRFSEAYAEWRGAADHGDAAAALYLGVLYDTGIGVAPDDRRALAWYEVAGAEGNVTAMLNAALMYDSGRGAAPDKGAAIGWYERAAAAGSARAAYNLGLLFEPTDRNRAIRAFRAASRLGVAAASSHLEALGIRRTQLGPKPAGDPAMTGFAQAQRVLLARGPVSAGEAVAQFRKAAEAGDALAAYNLAYCYEHGFGVPADPEQAKRWYRSSVAAAGNGPVGEIASAGLRSLEADVSPGRR